MSPAVEILSRRFAASFPESLPGPRTIGREAEYPVIREDGRAGDVPRLLSRILAGGGGEALSEGDLLVGIRRPDLEIVLEVGLGTIEVITPPQPDLHALARAHEAAMAEVLRAATAEGMRLLGSGMQPVARPSRALMSPKERYLVLLDVLGEPWLWFAVTASDQVQVDVARPELARLTSLSNLLAPVVVALCGNSPMLGGADGGCCSMREAGMGGILASDARHGMAAGPFPSVRDWVASLVRQPFLMRREGGRWVPGGRPFSRWLAEHGPDWDAFLVHEHYVWNSGRPRTAHGTIELRSACQQPWEDHMAAAALSLGIVEAAAEIQDLLDRLLGDGRWPAMRAWHAAAVREGLAAPEPARGLLEGVLAAAAWGLEARGFGEGELLRPLRERLEARRNPAQQDRDLLRRGGLGRVLERRALPEGLG